MLKTSFFELTSCFYKDNDVKQFPYYTVLSTKKQPISHYKTPIGRIILMN